MFDRPRAAQSHVGAWSAFDSIGPRGTASSVKPSFDFCRNPRRRNAGEIEALREFSSLLHVVDCAVGKRHDLVADAGDLRATCGATLIPYLHFFTLVEIEGDRSSDLKPPREGMR